MTTRDDTSTLAERLTAVGVSTVLTAVDPAYATELAGFNLHTSHSPDAVVVAGSADDVVRAIEIANLLGIPLTVVGHGHGMVKGIAGGIAVTTRGLAGVEIDVAGRTARIGAGTQWSDVISASAPHELAPLCGSAPHVGVVGYLLGGGVGPVARTFGHSADHVRSFEVVTGQGRLVVADRHQNPDLFWALRGGKGGLGVVTEVTIDLFPLPFVHGGGFFFDGADSAAVLHAFAGWTQSLSDRVTTSVALLRLPPLPDLPEPIRGRFVVHVRVVVVGADADDAARLVAPIREAATPLMDVFGTMPYAAIGMVHSDPVTAMPVVEGGLSLNALTPGTVDALLAVAGPGVDVPLIAVELRVLGGALAREPEVPNAVGGRDDAFALHVVGAPVPELLEAVVPAVIEGVFEAVEPWSTGGVLVNFFGNANAPGLLDRAWPAATRERLGEVRRAYDPDGRIPFALGT